MQTYALAVTVHGGLQPTPAQWAGIQAAVSRMLSAYGAVLVTDLALADRVIRVDFHPDVLDPESAGQITILGVRNNPYSGIASTYRSGGYAPGFSFASSLSHGSWWGSSNFYSGDYFNYVGPWENGYTSAPTVVINPKPVNPPPPHKPRPIDREICPPDALHPRHAPSYALHTASVRLGAQESSAGFANNSPATPAREGRQRWTGERSAWGSDTRLNRSYAASTRGDSSASRHDRTSRSDSSEGSRTSSRWWRPDGSSRTESSGYYRSEPSYSSSSYSSRDYSSSSSSSSSSSGSYSLSSSAFSTPSNSPSPSYSDSSSSSSSSVTTTESQQSER
jgi:hypothetical protein